MGISATTREWTRLRAFLYVAIAAALGVALNSTGKLDRQRPDCAGILASAGHPATIQVNRGAPRAEHARPRTGVPSACILVAGDHIARDHGRRATLAGGRRPRSLDPVLIESGRSPPLALS